MSEVLESLRDRLNFGKPSSFILRREKSQELKGLPQKYEHKIACDLSQLQRDMHIEYINRARRGGEANHPFAILQGLMKLYQHPALIPGCGPNDAGDLRKMNDLCPKIHKLIEILDKVKKQKEKALIFTRNINMQQLLASYIYQSFSQRVDIVNGAASRHETETSSHTRKAMINRFRTDEQLNFIILSPDVAGIGLNLVEANHVVHYGRWWNPAKESQATDRVYRIGQNRDVNVYYLIAKDHQGEFKTFDEKLDALIERRRKMAKDFLAPMPAEQDLQSEIYNDIISESMPQAGSIKSIGLDDVRVLPWDRFEALIALIEQRQGCRVFLTPKSGDMGIDVISINGDLVRLIQCKHRRYEDELGNEVVAEVVNAFDTYRSRIFAGTHYTLKPVLATNGRITQTVFQQCKQNDIDTISRRDLEKMISIKACKHADIEFMEYLRCESINKIREMIQQI
jgi:hypothetical protein